MKFVIYTDGGARGNPGPAAVGVVIQECQCVNVSTCQEGERKIVAEISKKIGETTNNVAEYTAVLYALQELKTQVIKLKTKEGQSIESQFFLDSMLVVNQLNGLFKVKDSKLRELLAQARILEQEVGGVISYMSIPREQNFHADALVNRALDNFS